MALFFKRLFRILMWDAFYCLLPTVGFAAKTLLSDSSLRNVIPLLVFAFCGMFLSQLSRWGNGGIEFFFTLLPALYFALAPYLAPLLALIPTPFPLVPTVLLSAQTELLRICWALAGGFVCWQKVAIRVS